MPNNDLDKKVESLIAEIKKSNPVIHKDETRRLFAFAFLIGYFVLLGCILLFVGAYNHFVIIDAMSRKIEGIAPTQLLDLERIFFLITSAFGPTLGFIIGYYFKDEKD